MRQNWTTIFRIPTCDFGLMTSDLRRLMVMAFVALSPWPAFACPVPVFRYALDRWPPDYYDAALIHRGQMTEDQNQLWDDLNAENDVILNLRLSKIDIASVPDDKVEGLFGGEIPQTLPVLALWYPWAKGRMPPVWQGRFTQETVTALVDSPVRRKLAERLTKGQAAVWLFLESGDADKDKASLQLLEQELEAATKELTETPSPFIDESLSPGLSYEFSTLALRRSDPQERVLLEMLLNSEPDLDEYADEPIVFPVFGRGRSLYALVGKGISSDNIREAIAFLTGPCGCEIKALNPGVDMLVAANWDQAVMALYEEFYYEPSAVTPELTGVFPDVPEVNDSEPSISDVNDVGSTIAVSDEADDKQAPAGNKQGQAPVLAGDEQEQQPEQVQPVEATEQKAHQLGVTQTTAVCLTIIVLAVVFGTLAMTRQRRGHV